MSGLLSASHTTWRGAGIRRSPVISMQILPLAACGGRYWQGRRLATEPSRAGPGAANCPVADDLNVLRPRAVPGVPGRFGANGVFCRTAADQAAGSADTGQSYLPAPDNYSLTTNTYNGIRLALLLSLLLGQGVPQVISSVSGQNVYSAQYTAYRRPSMPDNNQDGGWGSTNRAFKSSGMGGPGGIGGGGPALRAGGADTPPRRSYGARGHQGVSGGRHDPRQAKLGGQGASVSAHRTPQGPLPDTGGGGPGGRSSQPVAGSAAVSISLGGHAPRHNIRLQ